MIKINSVELENVKRVKAVALTPKDSGLTVIGGKNGQGKTSILDSIAWALGGAKFAPSEPNREGSMLPPKLKITLNNGMVVERSGKNSNLRVTDPTGKKCGQQILDELISELALNLPKFIAMNSKEKASVLLQIIGVGDELVTLDMQERRLYDERHAIGVIADTKAKHAADMPFYNDAPEELISVSDLINTQQEILAKNGEIQKKRLEADKLQHKVEQIKSAIAEHESRLTRLKADLLDTESDLALATIDQGEWQESSTEEIERSIANIEAINVKVRTNLDKQKAEMDAEEYKDRYKKLSEDIDHVREQKNKSIERYRFSSAGIVCQGRRAYFQWLQMG